jgi:hypothetical protein
VFDRALAPSMATALLALSMLAPADARAQAVGFQPGIGSFPNGVILPATPVVSADRRYVRLTLNPQFNALEGLDPFTVPAAVSGGGAGAGGLGGFGGLGGGRFVAGMDGIIDPGAASPLLAGLDRAGPYGPGLPAPEAAAVLSGLAGPVVPPRLSAVIDGDMSISRMKPSRVRRPSRVKHGR